MASKNPPLPQPDGYEKQCAEWLSSHNWRCSGRNARGSMIWADPLGATKTNPEGHAVTLKKKEGGMETFYQSTSGPIPWNYSTEEAMSIQRSRNEFEERKPKETKEVQQVA